MFSCEFCEIPKNTFFTEHLWPTASERTFEICLVVVNEFWVRLQDVKNENKTREKYRLEYRRQNLAETDRGSYYNQEEWLEEFLDDKVAFYDGIESDDSENDD